MDDIELLRELIGSAQRIVAFTGAGISTESGIPDFRSPGGIWTRYKPIYFDDFMASDEMRRESWRRKFATDETMLKAEPNAGHRALAKLVEQGRMSAIITQNVDGLHQRSGVPDSKVIELHGNATYASCLDCCHRHELEPIRKAFLGSGKLVVYPAAGFPTIAKRNGAKLVILNRDPTDQDDDADVVVHAEIGPTMSRAIGVN